MRGDQARWSRAGWIRLRADKGPGLVWPGYGRLAAAGGHEPRDPLVPFCRDECPARRAPAVSPEGQNPRCDAGTTTRTSGLFRCAAPQSRAAHKPRDASISLTCSTATIGCRDLISKGPRATPGEVPHPGHHRRRHRVPAHRSQALKDQAVPRTARHPQPARDRHDPAHPGVGLITDAWPIQCRRLPDAGPAPAAQPL